MTEIERWLAAAAERERNVVRLEDALLTDWYWRYSLDRLRFFALRTLVGVVVHAIRIALLFAAFPREQFAVIVLLGAVTALLNHGLLGSAGAAPRGGPEAPEGRPGDPDPGTHRHVAATGHPDRSSVRACRGGLAVVSLAMGWMGPVDLYGLVLIGGTGATIVARAYHSGAYALRRVYRPLPSLVAVDIGGLAALVVLWPVVGLWAFPLSELLAVTAVTAMSMHYTARTYRSLALPGFRALVSGGRIHAAPARAAPVVRASSGVDPHPDSNSLLVLTVLLASTSTGRGRFAGALLAALGPVIRAGFEWASLLYFDLVRLEAPLLSRLRERFDVHVRHLALVVGGIT